MCLSLVAPIVRVMKRERKAEANARVEDSIGQERAERSWLCVWLMYMAQLGWGQLCLR